MTLQRTNIVANLMSNNNQNQQQGQEQNQGSPMLAVRVFPVRMNTKKSSEHKYKNFSQDTNTNKQGGWFKTTMNQPPYY